jgi:hypothetical protein
LKWCDTEDFAIGKSKLPQRRVANDVKQMMADALSSIPAVA